MEWLFLIISVIAVGAAFMMLQSKNAVHSALFLIVNFGCVAFLYLMLDAPFLAMVQVAVYAGAIMVLFLFVIMLLGAEVTTDTTGNLRWLSLAGAAGAVLVLVIFGFPIASDLLSDEGLEPRTGTALVRVINAVPGGEGETFTAVEGGFEVPLETEVTTTVAISPSEEAGEAVTIEAVAYNDQRDEAREYVTLGSGEYTIDVTVSDGSYETTPIYSETLALDPNSAQSVIVHATQDGVIEVLLLEDDLSPTEMGSMRMTLFNGVADETVSLVDVGQYSTLQTLCEDDSCNAVIPHKVLIDAVPYAETTTINLDDGTYNLAFVNSENTVLRNIQNYEAERGVVETRVLVKEVSDLGGLPVYRAAVFGAVGSPSFGSPEAIGQVLFIDYLLPVQLVGILLLVALIGVIVLARPDALAQQERSRVNRRRRVSRPLVSVLSQQTGSDVLRGEYLAKLTEGSENDDPESK
jgi:NADH:ubiquinone oxidoreductase subunit 6 (subunit J)